MKRFYCIPLNHHQKYFKVARKPNVLLVQAKIQEALVKSLRPNSHAFINLNAKYQYWFHLLCFVNSSRIHLLLSQECLAGTISLALKIDRFPNNWFSPGWYRAPKFPKVGFNAYDASICHLALVVFLHLNQQNRTSMRINWTIAIPNI
jgi:hypothetical protein